MSCLSSPSGSFNKFHHSILVPFDRALILAQFAGWTELLREKYSSFIDAVKVTPLPFIWIEVNLISHVIVTIANVHVGVARENDGVESW